MRELLARIKARSMSERFGFTLVFLAIVLEILNFHPSIFLFIILSFGLYFIFRIGPGQLKEFSLKKCSICLSDIEITDNMTPEECPKCGAVFYQPEDEANEPGS